MAQEYLIALGSNLGSEAGDPTATIAAALARLTRSGAQLRRVSRVFATPCFPAGAGPDYANACALIHYGSDAKAFLQKLHEIEAEFGRARRQRWASRSLDLDLIAAGNEVYPDIETQSRWRELNVADQKANTPDQMILPHPRMQERAFVLVPLADVALGWQHPLLRQTVAELCAALPEETRRAVVPIGPLCDLSSKALRVT